jgi:hypothetical protein
MDVAGALHCTLASRDGTQPLAHYPANHALLLARMTHRACIRQRDCIQPCASI